MSAAGDGPAGAPLRPLRAVATAGLTGFGVMAAELTAVRLLAPHFGDSAYVWTNVIGVILAAMAIGAALGGRLSARADARAWPLRLLLCAGALLVVAPFVAGWLGDALLPDDLQLDAAMPALIRGSLVAAAVVFAPPLLLLAAVSPLLIVLLARSGAVSVGRAAGDLAAAGTAGSLVGTFAATHWLVPVLGCRVALVTAGVAMLLAGALVAAPRGRVAAGAVMLLGLGSALLHGGPLRPAPAGVELVAERETPYQFLQVLRVLRAPDAAGGGARTTLVINEGLDSFHSLAIEGTAFSGGAYYDWHAIAPFLAGDGGRPEDLRVLSIGDAAGTLREVYGAVHPGCPVDAVDIDAVTMALGDEHFAADKATGDRFALDGRVFLEHSERRWHVVHVDAYAHQVYVPAHLASVEFFRAARERLHDGGVLACNVGALDHDDAVLQAVAATVADVFEHVTVLLVPQSRNALLIARRGSPVAPALLASSPTPPGLSVDDAAAWADIIAYSSDPARWRAPSGDAPVLVDDRPLLDELLFESYVERRDPDRVVACTGTRSTTDAEVTAAAALQAGDWDGALAAVADSAGPTGMLRQLAGDARWYQRNLRSALREYEAGLELDVEPDLRAVLTRRAANAREALRPVDAADAAATRNGWLAALVTVLGCGLGAVVMLRRA